MRLRRIEVSMSNLENNLGDSNGNDSTNDAELHPQLDSRVDSRVDSQLARQLEGILMVVEEPIEELVLAQVTEFPTNEVVAALEELAASYEREGRGFQLRKVAGGWRYYSHPDLAPVVEKFVLDGQQTRLTQAALETLAVIAYRQPISRARISAIRGVNVEAVMKTLVNRGLVEESGNDQESGAILYRTTSFFLEKLGISALEDLPPVAPFLPDIDGLDEVLNSLVE
jgi:segregation and condensation protein B